MSKRESSSRPALPLTELDRKLIKSGVMSEIKAGMARNGDPLAPLEMFVLAHATKQPIPQWTLDHLATCFQNYYEAHGKIKLDEAFNLSERRGKKSIWQRSAIEELYEKLTRDLYILTVHGHTSEEAAELVSRKFEHEQKTNPQWNKTGYKIGPRGSSNDFTATLLDAYYRQGWRRRWKKHYATPALKTTVPDRKEFLKRFDLPD